MNSRSLTTAEATDALSRNHQSLRRRWWYLLPAVFVTYSLAYLDRANYGLGAAAGLARSLHITDKHNSRLAALFFLGYFIFQCRAQPSPGNTALRGSSLFH